MSIDEDSIERLTKLIAGLADRVPAEVLLRAKTDVDYGEYGMALENLCQCMYDVNVKLSAVHVFSIGRSAADFGLRRERWEFVERLVEDDDDAGRSGVTVEPIQVIPLLLAACPSFEPVFAAIEQDNVDDDAPGGRLLYLDAAEFIRHIGQLQLAESTDEFDAVFDVVERFLVGGDDYVSTLGVIGFLELLQMATISSLGLDPEVAFRRWFRPVSEAWWKRLNRFWSGEHDALQVTNEQVVAEARLEPKSDPR